MRNDIKHYTMNLKSKNEPDGVTPFMEDSMQLKVAIAVAVFKVSSFYLPCHTQKFITLNIPPVAFMPCPFAVVLVTERLVSVFWSSFCPHPV